MQQITLVTPKMSCTHCKMAIENAGKALAGVSAIEADPESKHVEITYDETVVSEDQIRVALAEAGYPAD